MQGNYSRILSATLLLAVTAGCNFDEPYEGASGGTGFGEPEGTEVRCCFRAVVDPPTWSTHGPNVPVCEYSYSECLDPVTADIDGNGRVDQWETDRFCTAKLDPWPGHGGIYMGNVPVGPAPWATAEELHEYHWGGTHYMSMAARDSLLGLAEVCTPRKPIPYWDNPWEHTVEPTHDTEFPENPQNYLEIAFGGLAARMHMRGEAAYSVFECEDYENNVCQLTIHSLSLALASPAAVGQHNRVTDANIRLAGRVHTDVTFGACNANTCTGTFELSSEQGSAPTFDVSWKRTDAQTGTKSAAALQVSNDGLLLGEEQPIQGRIVLNKLTDSGTLTLSGRNADTDGAAMGSVRFQFSGAAQPR